jgi:hypothetical protein
LRKYRFWDDDSVGVAYLSNAYVYSPHDDNNVIPARLPCQAGAALPIHVASGVEMTCHLPMEGAAVLLGVDALLDMARTSVNVLGNCLASAVVARWEGYKVG